MHSRYANLTHDALDFCINTTQVSFTKFLSPALTIVSKSGYVATRFERWPPVL